MTEAELIRIVVSFLTGGLAGAALTAVVNALRQKTELAFKVLEQYFARLQPISDAIGVLETPGSLKDPPSHNKVTSIGDWYEMVATLYQNRVINRKLLDKVGIVGQMRRFLNLCKLANTGGDLDAALKAWTGLAAATR